MTFIVRVMCRVNFKTVRMEVSYLVKSSVLSYRRGGTGKLFCSFWIKAGYEGAANVHANID